MLERAELALWGGVECTVNRVGDAYLDQLRWNGHDERVDDLERFTALGIRTLRYPFLWERIAPDGVERADWRWADERLARLVGIRSDVFDRDQPADRLAARTDELVDEVRLVPHANRFRQSQAPRTRHVR